MKTKYLKAAFLNTFNVLIYILVAALGVIACNGGSNSKLAQSTASIKSMDDLKQLLVPGMATNDILVKLGTPPYIMPDGSDRMYWQYDLKPFVSGGMFVVGLEISITNGHLNKWNCGYESIIKKEENILPVPMGNNTNSHTLKLCILVSDPNSGGRYIDTPRFPKLGFIQPAPSISFSKLKGASLQERVIAGSPDTNRTEYAFGFDFLPEDGKKFISFTVTNSQKRIVVTLDDEPVAVQTVLGQYLVGSYGFVMDHAELKDEVKNKLMQMIQP